MAETGEDLVRRLHQEELERIRREPPPPLAPVERPTIHWRDLPAAAPNSPLAREWDLYRREVGRLIAEGHEGQWVLMKNEQIVGMYLAKQDAKAAGYRLFPGQGFLVHQIQEREPLLYCLWSRLYRR
jgi:hypothetical protein